MQDFIDYDGPDRTGYAERYALGLGISPQSLYRYMKNVLEADVYKRQSLNCISESFAFLSQIPRVKPLLRIWMHPLSLYMILRGFRCV